MRLFADGMNHTCLAFPAEAGTHLPTPKGWKAELAWATRMASGQWTDAHTFYSNIAIFNSSGVIQAEAKTNYYEFMMCM